MDSFIDNMGRLIANKEIASMIDTAMKSKEPGVKDFVSKLANSFDFTEKAFDVTARKDAFQRGVTIPGFKIPGTDMKTPSVNIGWDNFQRKMAAFSLYGNVKNYVQGAYGSTLQNLINATLTGKKQFGNPLTSPITAKALKDPMVADTLYNNGFISRTTQIYEGMPESWKTHPTGTKTLGRIYEAVGPTTKNIGVWSSGIFENNAKADIALRNMQAFLSGK